MLCIFQAARAAGQSRQASAPAAQGRATPVGPAPPHQRIHSAGFSRAAGNPVITRDERGNFAVASNRLVGSSFDHVYFSL